MRNFVLIDISDFEGNIYDQNVFGIPEYILKMNNLESIFYDEDEFHNNFYNVFTDFIDETIRELVFEDYYMEFLEDIIENIDIHFVDDENYLLATVVAGDFTEYDNGFNFKSVTMNWQLEGERIHVDIIGNVSDGFHYLDEDCDDCNEYGCCDECECNENNGYCYNEDYGFYLIDDDYNDED